MEPSSISSAAPTWNLLNLAWARPRTSCAAAMSGSQSITRGTVAQSRPAPSPAARRWLLRALGAPRRHQQAVLEAVGEDLLVAGELGVGVVGGGELAEAGGGRGGAGGEAADGRRRRVH